MLSNYPNLSTKKILAVDTSSNVLSIAICSGTDAIFEANLDGVPRHSEFLIDFIQDGLRRLKIKKQDLEFLIWGMGPGSFTGLRIGLSALKGFQIGLKKKSLGGSSLDLIALGTGLTSGELAVCVDARRERIYTAIYRFKKGAVKKVLRDSILSFDELTKKLSPETVITGNALGTYGQAIRQRIGKEMLFLEPIFWYPRALFLIHLYESKHNWLKPLTLKSITPQYLRTSEAEEMFNKSVIAKRRSKQS